MLYQDLLSAYYGVTASLEMFKCQNSSFASIHSVLPKEKELNSHVK